MMATRYTVCSAKLQALRGALKGQAESVLRPCDGLVEAIESHDDARIAQLCEQYTRAMGPWLRRRAAPDHGLGRRAAGCVATLARRLSREAP